MQLLRSRAVVTPDSKEMPRIAGTPDAYDVVRFKVLEVLRGDVPAVVDLSCATQTCQTDDPNGPMLLFLPELQSGERIPNTFCRWVYLNPRPGHSVEPGLAELLDRLRAGPLRID